MEPNLQTHVRERIILEMIKENAGMHHNALLKQVVPRYMAKTTFEKTRNLLLHKEVITVKAQGNMKFYHITKDYEDTLYHKIEQRTNVSFHDLKLQVKRLDTDYSYKDTDEKIILANDILGHLLLADNGFTLLDSVKNPKKTLYRDEHLEIQQQIHHVFEMIRKDKDFEVILPSIAGNLGALML